MPNPKTVRASAVSATLSAGTSRSAPTAETVRPPIATTRRPWRSSRGPASRPPTSEQSGAIPTRIPTSVSPPPRSSRTKSGSTGAVAPLPIAFSVETASTSRKPRPKPPNRGVGVRRAATDHDGRVRRLVATGSNSKGASVTRIVHGDHLTMDPAMPRAEAMAVRGDRILAVGTRDDVARAAPGAPVVSVPGTVLPGFNDFHVHLLYAGLELRRVDLLSARSVGDVLEGVGAAAREVGDGWIHAIGNFVRDDLAEGRYPTRAELDAVSAGRPVFVDQRTHDALVNTAVLKAAGIGRDTADPPGGVIERDPEGEPTGRLVERPAF